MKNKNIANIEVERKIIGGILLDNAAIENVYTIIKPHHFFDKKHQQIFDAMIKLNDSSIPIDTVSLYEYFKTNSITIGASDLAEITAEVFSVANIEYHCKIVLDKFILREIIKTSNDLIVKATASKDPAELLVQSIDMLESINDYLGVTQSEKDIVEDAKNIFKQIREEQTSEEGVGYKTSLFESLNEATGGLMLGEYVVISGADKAGKTTFGLALMNDLVIRHEIAGAAFTYEMPYNQYVRKIISLITGTRYGYLRTPGERNKHGELHYDFQALEATSERFKNELENKTYFVIDEPLTETELKIKIKYLHRKHGVKIVMVDYIGLVLPENKKDRRDLEVASVSRMLKLLAQELKIIIIALSQENDEGSTADSKALRRDCDFWLSISHPSDKGKETFQYARNKTFYSIDKGTHIVYMMRSRHSPNGIQFWCYYHRNGQFNEIDPSKQNLVNG